MSGSVADGIIHEIEALEDARILTGVPDARDDLASMRERAIAMLRDSAPPPDVAERLRQYIARAAEMLGAPVERREGSPELLEAIAEAQEHLARLERERPCCPTCFDSGHTPGGPCHDCKRRSAP